MTFDYGLFLREEIYGTSGWQRLESYDLFLSAFNLGERIKIVFNEVRAAKKIWLIHEEYELGTEDLPEGDRFAQSGSDESTYCRALIDGLIAAGTLDPATSRLCIDITGILRPHLMFLILYLKRLGFRCVDLIYAEPRHYALKEKTPFSTGSIYDVRPVRGFEGSPSARGSNDFLVIGMGYDDRLLGAVAETKDKADKHQIFGLPCFAPTCIRKASYGRVKLPTNSAIRDSQSTTAPSLLPMIPSGRRLCCAKSSSDGCQVCPTRASCSARSAPSLKR